MAIFRRRNHAGEIEKWAAFPPRRRDRGRRRARRRVAGPGKQAQSWQDALKKSDDVEAARAAGEQAKEAAGSETTSDRLKGAASKGVGVAADETAQGADLKSAGKKGGSAALDAAVGSP